MEKFSESELKLLKVFRKEIENLVYRNPKCDFEHAWNCALDKADECFNGYEEDET